MVRDDHLFVPSNPFITRSNQKEFSVWIITTFLSRKDDKKEKKISYVNNALHLGLKYAWLFLYWHYFFWGVNSFLMQSLRKTEISKEQVMFKDK